MGHAFLTPYSCLALGGFISFFYYLSQSHKGPWHSKYDMPRLTKERLQKFQEFPEFQTLFTPDSHPGLKKNQRQ